MKAQQSKRLTYSIFFLQVLIIVHTHSLVAQQKDSSKVFTTQFYHEQYSVVLHSDKNKIIGTRDKKQIPSGLMESSVFIDANVSVMPFRDGAFQISPLDTNTWFIPMDMGKAPFKMRSGNCIRMESFLRSSYKDMCPPSTLLQLPDRLTFTGGFDAMCEKSYLFEINYVPCDSIYGYDFYFGGVIVQADSVMISDPVWFKPNPDATMMFKEDEHGNLIRYYPPKKKD